MWVKMDTCLSETSVSEVKEEEEDMEEEAAPSIIIPDTCLGPQYETMDEDREARELEQFVSAMKEESEIKIEEEDIPSPDDMSLSQEGPSWEEGRREQSCHLLLYQTTRII